MSSSLLNTGLISVPQLRLCNMYSVGRDETASCGAMHYDDLRKVACTQQDVAHMVKGIGRGVHEI